MTARVFLNEQHWAWLLKSVYQEVLSQGQPATGPLGQLWKLMAQANQHKRFSIEVENPDFLDVLGASDNDNARLLETARCASGPRPMASYRDDSAG